MPKKVNRSFTTGRSLFSKYAKYSKKERGDLQMQYGSEGKKSQQENHGWEHKSQPTSVKTGGVTSLKGGAY